MEAGRSPAASSPTTFDETTARATRPTTWGGCQEQELGTTANPCPWVSCRYHLLVEVRRSVTGEALRLNAWQRRRGAPSMLKGWATGRMVDLFVGRAVEELSRMRDTCALRVAERVPAGELLTLEELGDVLHLTREGARQSALIAEVGLLVAGGALDPDAIPDMESKS
jgi:hypothetical protein